MARQFNCPNSEEELRKIQDRMYAITKTVIAKGEKPRFKGLIELMDSEVVIKTAIHNLKANRGSETPGSDGETMRKHFLQVPYELVVERVRGAFENYHPLPVIRKMIPKEGTNEMRPLGIPVLADRVVQECVRIVIEPILEAQFFKHSYGYRPYRSAKQAIARITNQLWSTNYTWVVEGDISKFFDTVNHRKLLEKLWLMGIRDRRVLKIIREMLRAGVMNENSVNELGTPQGGIISPLLANVYLHSFDQWVTREWENKRTRYNFPNHNYRIRTLKDQVKSGKCHLKPCYLVRYADDWVLLTSNKKHAEKWKHRIGLYLQKNLSLKLSEKKTLITNAKARPINFLGFRIKEVPHGAGRFGHVPNVHIEPTKLQKKARELKAFIRRMKKVRYKEKEDLINYINKINSKIRGLVQHYQIATQVNADLRKLSNVLGYAAFKALKKYGGKWTPASETSNLLSIHSLYNTKIPAIDYKGLKVGITLLGFAKWDSTNLRHPDELTPFSTEGRKIYFERSNKKPALARMDDFLSLDTSLLVTLGKSHPRYNFEYFLNRAYVFNQDKGKCRICREDIWDPRDVHCHHVNPRLSLELVNRVSNLATVHASTCHRYIHNSDDLSYLGKKIWNKILQYREKLTTSVTD